MDSTRLRLAHHLSGSLDGRVEPTMNQKTVESMVSERSESNQKNYFVYIAQCADGSYYTGITDNIERRLKEHNTNEGGRYTRSFGPVRLLWTEDQPGYSAALKREAQIKRWTRAKKEAFLKGDLALLKRL